MKQRRQIKRERLYCGTLCVCLHASIILKPLSPLQPFMGMSRNVEECCVTSHPTLKETTLSHRMATENSHAAHTLKPYPYQVAGHAAQGEPYE